MPANPDQSAVMKEAEKWVAGRGRGAVCSQEVL